MVFDDKCAGAVGDWMLEMESQGTSQPISGSRVSSKRKRAGRVVDSGVYVGGEIGFGGTEILIGEEEGTGDTLNKISDHWCLCVWLC